METGMKQSRSSRHLEMPSEPEFSDAKVASGHGEFTAAANDS